MIVIVQVTVASLIVFSSVNPASLPPSSEPASWCILELDSGTMPDMLECSFDNPVKTIQLDYYYRDRPEVVVSCDLTCDVSAVHSTMFRVSNVQPRLLTVDVLQVSPQNAGKYRCQAMQEATQLAVEGKCTTAVGKRTEGEDGEDNYLLFLPVLAILPIALIIAVVVCKVKSCGFWKPQLRHEHETSSEGKAEDPEKESLTSRPDEQTPTQSEGPKIDRQEATTIGAAGDDVITEPNERESLLSSEDEQTDSESSDDEQLGHDFPDSATDAPPLSPLEKIKKSLEGEGHSPKLLRQRSMVHKQIKFRSICNK